MKQFIMLLSLLGITSGAQAALVTIGFEEFTVGATTPDQFTALQSKGFDIRGNLSEFPGEIEPASVLIGDNGTQAFGGQVSGFGQDPK
jgi:hypothetical protein